MGRLQGSMQEQELQGILCACCSSAGSMQGGRTWYECPACRGLDGYALHSSGRQLLQLGFDQRVRFL